MAGFEFLYRDNVGTDVPPVALFGQIGSLYPTTVAFGEVDPTIGQLWLQQIVDKKVGFRIGKYNPVPAYDFFPMKNFRTDFVDGVVSQNWIVANLTLLRGSSGSEVRRVFDAAQLRPRTFCS